MAPRFLGWIEIYVAGPTKDIVEKWLAATPSDVRFFGAEKVAQQKATLRVLEEIRDAAQGPDADAELQELHKKVPCCLIAKAASVLLALSIDLHMTPLFSCQLRCGNKLSAPPPASNVQSRLICL